jgi:hypothetical protein
MKRLLWAAVLEGRMVGHFRSKGKQGRNQGKLRGREKRRQEKRIKFTTEIDGVRMSSFSPIDTSHVPGPKLTKKKSPSFFLRRIFAKEPPRILPSLKEISATNQNEYSSHPADRSSKQQGLSAKQHSRISGSSDRNL